MSCFRIDISYVYNPDLSSRARAFIRTADESSDVLADGSRNSYITSLEIEHRPSHIFIS